MTRAQSGATRIGALLLLLLLLGGAGGWNYQRNLEAENARPRPYRGLAEPDLAALADAFEGEVEVYRKRYEAATGRSVSVADGQLLGDQIREFERVQSLSESSRQIGRALAEREGALRRVREEQRMREAERDRLALHLRRLLTI